MDFLAPLLAKTWQHCSPKISSSLLRAIDPDVIAERATGKPGASPDEVAPALMDKSRQELIAEACKPFDKPPFRDCPAQAKQEAEQIIDVTTIDKVAVQGFDAAAKEKAASLVKTFRDYVKQHRAEMHLYLSVCATRRSSLAREG